MLLFLKHLLRTAWTDCTHMHSYIVCVCVLYIYTYIGQYISYTNDMETVQAQCKSIASCVADRHCQVLKRPAARKWGQHILFLTNLAVSEVAPDWPMVTGKMMKNDDKTSTLEGSLFWDKPLRAKCFWICQERSMKIGVSDPGQCPTLWSDRWLVLGETVDIDIEQQWTTEMWR